MAVKPDSPEGKVVARHIRVGIGAAAALGFSQGANLRTKTSDDYIVEKRREIDGLASHLNREMMVLVRLLADRGAWNEAVRLVVGMGGYRPAELAEVLSVMRSTVTRWYNCETKPQEAQIPIYAKRLLAYMEQRRPIERIVDPKDLIEA